MSLSRSPSPVPGGGWASPGLNISGRSSPAKGYSSSNAAPGMWESSRLKNSGPSGYPSFSTQNQGFFTRHMRRISSSLPRFHANSQHYAEKEKLGRGRWSVQNVPLLGRLKGILARMGRKLRLRLFLALLAFVTVIIFYNSRRSPPSPKTAASSHLFVSPTKLTPR